MTNAVIKTFNASKTTDINIAIRVLDNANGISMIGAILKNI